MKKKRFADGDLVKGTTNLRTRSDEQIADTDRFGNYKPGSYAARQEQGQKNLDAVKGFYNRLTGKSTDAAPAAPVTYEESPAAKYIKKSVGQESAVSRPSESTISGSQVDKNKNYESEAAPTPAPAPAPAARRLPITTEGDYSKKNDTAGTSVDDEVAKSVTKAQPKIDAAVKAKKAKEAETSKSKKSENPVPTNFGKSVNPYQKKDQPAPAKQRETYRDLKGKVQYKEEEAPRSDKEWGTQNIKRNLQSAPSDIMSGLKKAGSAIADYKFETPAERRSREAKEPKSKAATPYSRTQTERDDEALTRGSAMKRGGAVKKMASGGMTSRSSASSRGDGIASRGKTRGKIC